ncbi:high affinity copper uptake protein 1-like [Mercenaria mercenaria]|uniref:high affinity copper uptake protein 1-like n=1 Tax=Mercenaria mercenaria TaxID=6596 RepID=UPI00234F1807|nr:high affinity copper uptake protein 1-like [Mercenaria mercenaria]
MDHSSHTHLDHTHDGHEHHIGHQNHVDHQGDQHVYHVTNEQSHDHHSLHGSHDHQAFFHTKLNATVLFENWVLDTKGSIFLACLCTFVLAIGYQGTKWLRQYLHVHYGGRIHSIKSKEHLLQTVLYVTEFLVSYLLMLIVMTYSVWVFVVTILGIALGYFLLAWHKEFKPVPVCAGDCETVINNTNKNMDPNSPSQELMPLEKQPAACNDCGIEELNVEDS